MCTDRSYTPGLERRAWGAEGVRGRECKVNREKEVSRILLDQAKCPGSHEWVPCGASPCPLRSMSWSLGEARTWGADPPTPSTHLTDPRWVLRGAGPSLRARGGGRSHVHVLGTPSLGQVRPSRVSSSLPLRACGVRAHPGTRVLLGGRRRSAVAGIARGGLLPKPTYLPAGCRGVMARRVGCGLDRRQRSKRLLLVARGERGGLLPSPRAGRAMSSWTAPRNMSICTTACRSSRGGWG